MSNPRVKKLQARLNELGFNAGRVDGRYGDQTARANMAAIDEAEPPHHYDEHPLLDQGFDGFKRGDFKPPYPVMSNFADYKIPKRFTEIIIHCSATPEGREVSPETIKGWHLERGFSDIGYHFGFGLDGHIWEGRSVSVNGAHCKGRNHKSLGIVYVGGVDVDGRPKDTRTALQRQAMLRFIMDLVAVNPQIKRISGHNQYAAKACPSFDVARDELGNIAGFRHGKKKWLRK